MTSTRTLCRSTAVLIVAGCLTLQANAQLIPTYSDEIRNYDRRDVALLPPFCLYTQDFRDKLSPPNDRGQFERWQAALGPTFNHLHHFCFGLINANRGLLLARSELARRHFLNNAVLEFDYVIERSPRDFVLLPEVLARKGQVQLRQEQTVAGLESLERSIELKADYWLPYAYASDHFKNAGDFARAHEWLARGLGKAPESPALQLRLKDLDAVRSGRKGVDR